MVLLPDCFFEMSLIVLCVDISLGHGTTLSLILIQCKDYMVDHVKIYWVFRNARTATRACPTWQHTSDWQIPTFESRSAVLAHGSVLPPPVPSRADTLSFGWMEEENADLPQFSIQQNSTDRPSSAQSALVIPEFLSTSS